MRLLSSSLGLALASTLLTAAPEAPSDLAPRAQAAIAETFGALSQNLMKALQEGGVRQAVPFCRENAAALVKPVAEKHGLRIQRVSHKARNPANRASEAELALIQSLNQAVAEGRPLQPQIVPQPDGSRVFYAPILIPADACLKCHGIPGETLSAADHDFIRSLYPEDAATGFKLGDLRGLWKVTFPKP